MSIDTGVKRVDSNVQVSIDTSVKGCRAGGLKFTTWKRDHTTQYSLAAVSQRSVAPWAWRKPQSRSPVEQSGGDRERYRLGRVIGIYFRHRHIRGISALCLMSVVYPHPALHLTFLTGSGSGDGRPPRTGPRGDGRRRRARGRRGGGGAHMITQHLKLTPCMSSWRASAREARELRVVVVEGERESLSGKGSIVPLTFWRSSD